MSISMKEQLERKFYNEDCAVWGSRTMRCHEKYVAVKATDPEGERKESVFIPTDKWYLNGDYEVFHMENTEWLHPEDEGVFEAMDATEYKIGHCYGNTEELVANLAARGIEAVPYVGWLFTGSGIYPIHHSWCVIKRDGSQSVIDLSDDMTVFSSYIQYAERERKEKQEPKEMLLEFTREVREQRIPNSIRCTPVGQVFPDWLYVGCPCAPEDGRLIYNRLLRRYPNHECGKRVGKDSMTALQREINRLGLM